MKSSQEILNAVRIDENGNSITVLESSQESLNAVYSESEKALRVKLLGGDVYRFPSWDAAETYQVNDFVTYNGVIYVALQININLIPSENSEWLVYLPSSAMPLSYLDTDASLTADSDTKVASQKAVKAYISNYALIMDMVFFMGTMDCSGNPNLPAGDAGNIWIISVAGKIGGVNGETVEVGDMLICLDDETDAGDWATVGIHWDILQKNITGAVTGTPSSTDNAIVKWDSTSGKVIQNSGVTIDDDNKIIQTTILDNATGDESAYTLNYTTNKASGSDTGLLILQTDTLSQGSSYLLAGKTDNTYRFIITAGGMVYLTDGIASIGSNQPLRINPTTVYNNASAAVKICENITVNNPTGSFSAVTITPIYNQTGDTANTDFKISRTETAVGSGVQNFTDFQKGSASVVAVRTSGELVINGLSSLRGSVSVADEGTISLCTGKAGFGTVQVGDNEEYGTFRFSTIAVTLIEKTGNVVNTDSDNKICILYVAGVLTLKNRLGSAKTVRYEIKCS